MASEPRSPTTNLEDTMLVAYMALKGHKVKPWRDTANENHVTFDIEGDADVIESDMQKYYANDPVGVQDFVKCLREVKSQMYNFKKLAQK